MLPTQLLPSEADVSLGVAIILDMRLCSHAYICLCLQAQLDSNPIYSDPKFVFMHVETEKVLLVVKTLIKNISAAIKVYSSSHTN